MNEKKVLLIDDNEEFRWLVHEVLDRGGFEVIEADDGYDGLARLAIGEVPDLVITDVHMPGMDGILFLKSLRKDPVYASVPVIICSNDDLFKDLPIDLGDVRSTGKDINTILTMTQATKWQVK